MRRCLAVAAVAAAALIGAAPASAQDSFTFGDADVIGPVHVRGDVAQVHARYSCDVGTHIWTSAKQNATATIDPAISAEGGQPAARMSIMNTSVAFAGIPLSGLPSAP